LVTTQPYGEVPEKRVCEGGYAPFAHPFFGLIRSMAEQLLCSSVLVDPALAFDQVRDNGYFGVFAAVGVDRRPQGYQPKQWRADRPKSQGHSAKDENDGPDGNIENDRLYSMEFDERAAFLFFHQENDNGNQRDGISQGGPKFIVAGGIWGECHTGILHNTVL